MNALTTITVAGTAEATMSSREIAALVDVRHDNVKRTIERLADREIIGLPPLEEYLDALRRPAKQYLVGKRDSYVIVAQLSPEFTARLVDRWQELENAQPKADPMAALADPTALRGLLLGYSERVIERWQTRLSASCPRASEGRPKVSCGLLMPCFFSSRVIAVEL